MHETDILFTLPDMSHAPDGYPIYSAGHVSYRRGISLHLRWTCLMHETDIPFTLLDMSHTGEGYPLYSTGHVSCTRWISHLLHWACLIQERDILISLLDRSYTHQGYPPADLYYTEDMDISSRIWYPIVYGGYAVW